MTRQHCHAVIQCTQALKKHDVNQVILLIV